MNYQEKYLKYKNKYLELQNQIKKGVGGASFQYLLIQQILCIKNIDVEI